MLPCLFCSSFFCFFFLIFFFFFFLMIRRPPRSTLFPLHDALPISSVHRPGRAGGGLAGSVLPPHGFAESPASRHERAAVHVHRLAGDVPGLVAREEHGDPDDRSEEHTSELQSRSDLVCRLLLEKKK